MSSGGQQKASNLKLARMNGCKYRLRVLSSLVLVLPYSYQARQPQISAEHLPSFLHFMRCPLQ